MSSFITRFLANMTMKESKPQATPAAEARPRRHERSSKQHHHHHHRHSRQSSHRSSYVYDSDETETDDEPLSENSLMLDLGPDYSPKAMSSISFPSPPMRGSTVLFETDDLDSSPQHIEVYKPARTADAQSQRKPVQYYDTPAAHAEANFRQQRGRSSSRSSTASQERRSSNAAAAYGAGLQAW